MYNIILIIPRTYVNLNCMYLSITIPYFKFHAFFIRTSIFGGRNFSQNTQKCKRSTWKYPKVAAKQNDDTKFAKLNTREIQSFLTCEIKYDRACEASQQLFYYNLLRFNNFFFFHMTELVKQANESNHWRMFINITE